MSAFIFDISDLYSPKISWNNDNAYIFSQNADIIINLYVPLNFFFFFFKKGRFSNFLVIRKSEKRILLENLPLKFYVYCERKIEKEGEFVLRIFDAIFMTTTYLKLLFLGNPRYVLICWVDITISTVLLPSSNLYFEVLQVLIFYLRCLLSSDQNSRK